MRTCGSLAHHGIVTEGSMSRHDRDFGRLRRRGWRLRIAAGAQRHGEQHCRRQATSWICALRIHLSSPHVIGRCPGRSALVSGISSGNRHTQPLTQRADIWSRTIAARGLHLRMERIASVTALGKLASTLARFIRDTSQPNRNDPDIGRRDPCSTRGSIDPHERATWIPPDQGKYANHGNDRRSA